MTNWLSPYNKLCFMLAAKQLHTAHNYNTPTEVTTVDGKSYHVRIVCRERKNTLVTQSSNKLNNLSLEITLIPQTQLDRESAHPLPYGTFPLNTVLDPRGAW